MNIQKQLFCPVSFEHLSRSGISLPPTKEYATGNSDIFVPADTGLAVSLTCPGCVSLENTIKKVCLQNPSTGPGGCDPSGSNEQPDKEQCKVCMWTGVATCMGLSLFFMKQALLDLPETGSKKAMRQVGKQKHFLFTCSAASALAGAYRYCLG
mmetsp:Transcript_5427/g.15807  ORF Transcript_5427/g.15807 Transcript_5427/m.15807 type:complete len:153 (-) Transcript_5427:107-565(-)